MEENVIIKKKNSYTVCFVRSLQLMIIILIGLMIIKITLYNTVIIIMDCYFLTGLL